MSIPSFMNATVPPESPVHAEFLTWSPVKKLAALVMMLSPESGAQILKGLEQSELEAVAAEMAQFTTISQELQLEVLTEFSGVALEAVSAVSCGVHRVRSLLENSVGLFKASSIVCRVAPSRAPVEAMQQIADMDARQISALLRHQQLPTIALVVSYLPPEKAAQILLGFKPEFREQIIERLATLAPASTRVVESVAEELYSKSGADRNRALHQTGGLKMAAQVLNALPRNVSDPILVSLRERNYELGEAVRRKMFTFEELERLDARTLQKILQVVDMQTLSTALKTASDKLKTKLLSCISKRAAETVREEIELAGAVKLRDIEAAQMQIIETVRRLESENEIDLEDLHRSPRY